ncbi:MAG: 3-phosphoshikimate 1-carboxyvinyltransferase [Crocinitomicaceae bacterium]|nr:3-phosphoshikimate 1-carboxyvinyltransferase [Crocinitomicaceae bacterium]
MDKITVIPGSYQGIISIPSSKSDGQRAILAAALSKGISTIYNLGHSDDELAMLDAVIQLGADAIQNEDKSYTFKGIADFPKEADLFMRESGLGTRLITGVCAANVGNFKITGSGSILKRSMHFFETYLPFFGAQIKTNNGHLPFEIFSPMQGAQVVIDGSQSSQYVSSLLMALPLLPTESRLEVENLKSIPYLKMTLNTLAKFGISILQQDLKHFIIAGNQKYLSTSYTVEGDWSSASFWLVASALGQKISIRGLDLASLQADKQILKAFEAANCTVVYSDDAMYIQGKNRTSFEFDATHCPDLFPALVSLASLSEGESKIRGVNRLANKESNRGEALKTEFAKLGVPIHVEGDLMRIEGQKSIAGGTVSSHNDHRIAMCLAIAGLFSTSPITVSEPDCVRKSYADFWMDLEGMHQKK